MRTASKRSSRFISKTTQNAAKCYYSSGSSSSGSTEDRDGAFSKLLHAFTGELTTRGVSNPTFSDMLSAVSDNPKLREQLSQFAGNATGGLVGSQTPARIAVTGAAGAIGYSLLFRLAAGELLGQNRPIILSCLEIPNALNAMEGVKMELKDCAFPLLRDVIVTDDPEKAFEGAEFVFLVGAFPRGKGMDRAQLLQKNAGIFSVQGKALNKSANRDVVKTLVVGNPANTNCLIAAYNSPNISPFQFSAMTRLDHNRGLSQLADKIPNTAVTDISQFAIWGNHSDTQFPDLTNTIVKGSSAKQTINDDKWISGTFIPTVAKRGAAIIAARGVSSAASAANAAIDQMRDWELGTNGNWTSMAVWTGDQGEKVPYGEAGIGNELYYSYPVICAGGKYKIVEGLQLDEDSKKRIQVSNAELEKERSDAGLVHRK